VSKALLAVIVVNYGSPDLVEHSYVDFDFAAANAQLVLVDNFRDPASTDAARALCARKGWEFVESKTNAGFGAGVNAGARRAEELGAEALLIANPDLVVSTVTATALAREALEDRNLALSPRMLREDGSIWFDGADVLVQEGTVTMRSGSDSAGPTGWLSGACIFLSAELWSRAGGFSEEYFLYWEDVDFSWRIRRAGGRLRVASDHDVVHQVGGTQEGPGRSPAYVYYNCRNRMLFAVRHLSAADVTSWRRGAARYCRKVLLRGGKRAILASPIELTTAALRGYRDGVRLARGM